MAHKEADYFGLSEEGVGPFGRFLSGVFCLLYPHEWQSPHTALQGCKREAFLKGVALLIGKKMPLFWGNEVGYS